MAYIPSFLASSPALSHYLRRVDIHFDSGQNIFIWMKADAQSATLLVEVATGS